MRESSQIQMKKTVSNPAKDEVFQAGNESSLATYVKEIASIKSLSIYDERKLAKRAAENDLEAKKQLVQSNLKLVVSIARKAIHMSNLPMIDLIQEGNLGLMIAVEKFNWKLGYKFSTYASWWIKQSMFKAISEQSYCMKIPVYIQETLSKFSKIKSEMERQYNCQIKNDEVAKRMNISIEKIDTYLAAYSKSVSLEGSMNNEDGRDMNFAEIIPDDKTSVVENVEFENLKKDIENVVATLKARERDVVRMRYGLDGLAKKTLEEIGNMYGVTKECIRQTEIRALKKLRLQGQEVLHSYI